MTSQTFKIVELIEKKQEVINQAIKGELHPKTTWQLLMVSFLCIGTYGFVIGCNHSFLQGLVSAIKLPVIFIVSASICYPTLYLFLSLLGLGYKMKQLAHFLLLCLALNGIVLISFSPITTFFLLTKSSYVFFKTINVFIMAIGGFTSVFIFRKYLFSNEPKDWQYQAKVRSKLFILLWLIMYGLIGVNLGFYLSPVFGIPNEPFIWITQSSQNFFSHIFTHKP